MSLHLKWTADSWRKTYRKPLYFSDRSIYQSIYHNMLNKTLSMGNSCLTVRCLYLETIKSYQAPKLTTQKIILKNATYLILWGDTALCHTFLVSSLQLTLNQNWCVTMWLIIFEIFTVKWQKIGVWEAKNGPPEPISWPRICRPQRYRQQREEDMLGTQFYHRAKFQDDQWHRHQDIHSRTKNTDNKGNVSDVHCMPLATWCKGSNFTDFTRRSLS